MDGNASAASYDSPVLERLGEYEILARLAVGGMAELFLARLVGVGGFEKHLVLKRILPQYLHDESFVTMFIDEARLAASLQHPNIAQVYDVGHEDGEYFFTMEYLHGANLLALMIATKRKYGLMPLAQALTIVAGAAAGLHYAHEERTADGRPLRIVHRDISPANLLVTFEGGVKIVDFGIASAKFRDTRTRDGLLKGKVGYMSPEQCLGGVVDRRSDVYALGIVLWETTTMRRLFRRSKRDNDFDIMSRIAHGDVIAPNLVVSDYDPELERIVMRALATDPDARYASCKDLLVDVEALAERKHLQLSTFALARFVRDTLGERPKPWHHRRDVPMAPGAATSGGSAKPPTLTVVSAPPTFDDAASEVVTEREVQSFPLTSTAPQARPDDPPQPGDGADTIDMSLDQAHGGHPPRADAEAPLYYPVSPPARIAVRPRPKSSPLTRAKTARLIAPKLRPRRAHFDPDDTEPILRTFDLFPALVACTITVLMGLVLAVMLLR